LAAVDHADARSFDLFSLPDSYFDDPYPSLAALREHDPLHHNADSSVLVTRYDDVKTVWRDPTGLVDKSEMFRAKFGDGPLLEHHTTAMLFRDPPDHDRLREIVRPFFNRPRMLQLQEFVESLVDGLLDEAAERRELDFVPDFAFRVPISVICRILGAPPEDGRYIHELGARILFPLNPRVTDEVIRSGHEAAAEFSSYLAEHIQHARASGRAEIDPPETMIDALVAAEAAGGVISDAEMIHMCILMLNGGHETTTNLLAVSVHSLIEDPEQLQDLRANGEEISRTAAEECIRFVSPLQLQGRRTTRAVTLPSGTIEPNTEVIICQAAANHDGRAFERPDALDLRRHPNPHFAFGTGVHACIGRPLARLEASVALPALARRFGKIERRGPAVFNRNARFRGLASLPLSLS
jgi:cytochrome P450